VSFVCTCVCFGGGGRATVHVVPSRIQELAYVRERKRGGERKRGRERKRGGERRRERERGRERKRERERKRGRESARVRCPLVSRHSFLRYREREGKREREREHVHVCVSARECAKERKRTHPLCLALCLSVFFSVNTYFVCTWLCGCVCV